MIRKSGKGFVLMSKDGTKRLSKKGISRKAALKRERQVEYFKHHPKGKR